VSNKLIRVSGPGAVSTKSSIQNISLNPLGELI